MKNTTKRGLEKTRKSFSQKINHLIATFRQVDDVFFEELEEILILSDVGSDTSFYLLEKIKTYVKKNNIKDSENIKYTLAELISEEMVFEKQPLTYPCVLLVAGVNGVGKTTFIGKMAHLMKEQGKTVVLAAADTFRAAASEQLFKWAKRANVSIVKHHEGADPSAVVYDAILSAKAKNADLLICDTAGRLHNKKNLMEELAKINRVIDKEYKDASKMTFLVVDATSGQNAINQVKSFKEYIDVDGLVLNKLDGTAKGGVVIGIKRQLNIPVYYIGVGEGIEDILEFDSEEFASNLIE